MKKLLAMILILALLVPALALADESDVIGCWVHYELLTTGAPSVTFLYLAEGGVCYYLIQTYKPDDVGMGRTFVGTWEFDKEDTVTAKTGNNAKTTLYFSPDGSVAMDTRTMQIYVNLSVLGMEW